LAFVCIYFLVGWTLSPAKTATTDGISEQNACRVWTWVSQPSAAGSCRLIGRWVLASGQPLLLCFRFWKLSSLETVSVSAGIFHAACQGGCAARVSERACFLAPGCGTRWSTACSPQGFGFCHAPAPRTRAPTLLLCRHPPAKGALLCCRQAGRSPCGVLGCCEEQQGAGIVFAVNLPL